MEATENENTPHVQAKFFTSQAQYSVPDTPFSLPSSASSKELNDLIHHLLNPNPDEDELEIQVEFDFLIDREFLRSTLEAHLEDKDVSPETVLEIEYVERQAAPRPETSLAHDDWVSCVRGNNQLILCGCYDNTLRLWTHEGQCLTTIPGHSGAVKCVAWLTNKERPDDTCMFASGSHDQTLFIWRWNAQGKEVDCLFACRGHAGSVDCVAVNSDGQRLVTGSWDKMLKLWTTDASVGGDDAEEMEEKKKSKKLKHSGPTVKTRVPLVTLSGHREAVSSLVWLDHSSVCSASWDHTLRMWDMTRSEQTQAMEGSKAFFSISHSPLNNLIVSASADRHIRIHDIRTKEMKGTYTSHTGWVSSVDWSRNNENLFLSGSHDMLVKLWDVRSSKAPLYNLIGQEDKVLCVDWSIQELMLSGGADNSLKIFKYDQQKK